MRTPRRFACVLLGLAASACAPMQVGESCAHSASCVAGAECAHPAATGDAVCLPTCVSAFDDVWSLCAGGEVCYPIGYADLTRGACYPGGTTAIDAPCTYPTECVRGAVCEFGSAMVGTCRRVCNGAPCVPAGEPCARSTDCVSGICLCTDERCLSSVGHCVEACTPPLTGDASLCANGDVCWTVASGAWACLPPGGVPVGGACRVVDDCVQGAICTSTATCSHVCASDAECPASMHCSAGVCL